MTLLLLGPRAAVLVAAAGVWTQCTVKIKRPYPWYRTIFSIAAEAVTMAVSGRRVRVARRPLGSCRRVVARQTTRWNDCDVLCRQYRAHRGGDRPDVEADVRASLVRGLPVERGQLHGGWDGRGCRGGRDRARGALESRADAGTGVSDVQDVSGVRRPARGPRSSCARDAAAARGNRRGAVAGASGGARAGGREGSPGRHGRRADAARSGTQAAARARARGARERRRRQPPEGSVPRDRLARAAHAAQRDPRLGGHVAPEHARRSRAATARPMRSTRTRNGRRG